MTCSAGYGISVMPRAKGPGRPRKFTVGAVVNYPQPSGLQGQGVVVDYKATPKDSSYRIVRMEDRKARWYSSTSLSDTGRVNTDVLRIYRGNERFEDTDADRGCDSHCCVHQAVPRRYWREDVDG